MNELNEFVIRICIIDTVNKVVHEVYSTTRDKH